MEGKGDFEGEGVSVPIDALEFRVALGDTLPPPRVVPDTLTRGDRLAETERVTPTPLAVTLVVPRRRVGEMEAVGKGEAVPQAGVLESVLEEEGEVSGEVDTEGEGLDLDEREGEEDTDGERERMD